LKINWPLVVHEKKPDRIGRRGYFFTALFLSLWLGVLAGCGPFSCEKETKRKTSGTAEAERQRLNIKIEQAPGADWSCFSSATCNTDYLLFPYKAAEYAQPISKRELDKQIRDLKAKTIRRIDFRISEEQLAEKIIANLNIGFLREGLDDRLLEVKITSELRHADFLEQRLLFDDPFVGRFKAILLAPYGTGPFPAVIALHGHFDSAEIFCDAFHGHDFPAHGYAILMLDQRSMNSDEEESEIAQLLLLNGFTFLGLRNYETLLSLKFLRRLDTIDSDHIGLIGHSGGSVTSLLTYWTEKKIAAFVCDEFTTFGGMNNNLFSDQTIPPLYPYCDRIYDITSGSRPAIMVDYGYQEQKQVDQIFAFFDAHLKPKKK